MSYSKLQIVDELNNISADLKAIGIITFNFDYTDYIDDTPEAIKAFLYSEMLNRVEKINRLAEIIHKGE